MSARPPRKCAEAWPETPGCAKRARCDLRPRARRMAHHDRLGRGTRAPSPRADVLLSCGDVGKFNIDVLGMIRTSAGQGAPSAFLTLPKPDKPTAKLTHFVNMRGMSYLCVLYTPPATERTSEQALLERFAAQGVSLTHVMFDDGSDAYVQTKDVRRIHDRETCILENCGAPVDDGYRPKHGAPPLA